MTGRRILMLAVVGLSLEGCGGSATKFDNAAEYTSESLGQEVLFRYRALSPAGKVRRAGTSKPRVIRDEPGKAAVDESSKKTIAKTVDDIAEETAVKMLLIKSAPREQVLKQIEKVIVDDPQLGAKDKGVLVDALGSAAGGK